MKNRPLSAWVSAALLIGALTACSGPAPQSPPTPADSSGPSGSPSPAESHRHATGGEPEVLATNLTTPWGLIDLGGGKLLVSERDSREIVLVEGGRRTPLRTIGEVNPGGEGGLLGVVLTPDKETLFAYFTAAEDNRIVAMSWDGKTLGEPRPILTGIPKGGRHDGGRLAIGPDGFLYASTGEVGDTSLAQDTNSLGGKILRLTLDGKAAPGNPFGNEVYSYGHRNVEGLAFDEQGRLWASEFGEQSWDELNLITKGANYGWPLVEGMGKADGMTNPKQVWSTADASPSGLAYWHGSLWMAALRGQQLWEIPLTGDQTAKPVSHLKGEFGRLRTVAVSADGDALLIATSNTDGRGDPIPADDRVLQFTP